MMNAKHTPGPWHRGGKHGIIIYDPDGFPVADAKVFHNRRVPGETEGNARLIAAAPELLSQLEIAVEQCPCSIAERLSGHRVECYASAAIEVIAKAKGSYTP